MKSRILLIAICIGLFPTLPACSVLKGGDVDATYPVDQDEKRRLKRGRITGDGIKLFSTNDSNGGGGGSGIGVNSYLWRATLDTISFMPLSSVDPHGGVIITDWYEDPDAQGERFKVNVLILDTELRTDALRVSVFRQKRSGGGWRDSSVSKQTAIELEDKILTRARQLRISQGE